MELLVRSLLVDRRARTGWSQNLPGRPPNSGPNGANVASMASRSAGPISPSPGATCTRSSPTFLTSTQTRRSTEHTKARLEDAGAGTGAAEIALLGGSMPGPELAGAENGERSIPCSCKTFWTMSPRFRSGPPRSARTPRSSPTIPRRSTAIANVHALQGLGRQRA